MHTLLISEFTVSLVCKTEITPLYLGWGPADFYSGRVNFCFYNFLPWCIDQYIRRQLYGIWIFGDISRWLGSQIVFLAIWQQNQ